jgi:hypothetical protein
VVENIERSLAIHSPATTEDMVSYHSQAIQTRYVFATIFGALALGLFGLFAMFPIGSAGVDKIILLVYPFMAGSIIGFLSPRLWGASIFVAWGGLILVNITSLGGTASILVSIVRTIVYIILALMAGYMGRIARKQLKI